MKDFSFKDRWSSIRRMEKETFDLVIIGGGINGAGIARDAASRGMSVALIEANDFASGTSSKSSKLIHGGIRYLENYEFGLVFEALSERAKLFQMAPHLVHPLRFLIPLFKGGRVGMGLMGIGMWLYDALALFDVPQVHERLNAEEALERIPYLKADGLLGAYEYSDAYMDDDRLVIETLRSAFQYKSAIANYVEARGAIFNSQGRVVGVSAYDKESKKSFSIQARQVISTVGPWTDELGVQVRKDWKPVLRPTKGVHIVLDRQKFPISRAVVMGAESRIVFVIPRHEMLIIGTTDTDFNVSPTQVGVDPADVKYLLSVFNSYFPGQKIAQEDLISAYAGVRPLVQDGAETEGKTSREHTIWTDTSGVTFVAGGKYTTYRLIAEQAVEKVLGQMSLEDQVRFMQSRSKEPLNPMVQPEHMNHPESFIPEMQAQSRLSESDCELLLSRHGGEAIQMIQRYGKDLDLWQYEAAHAIMSTCCFSLEDFYFRRYPAFLSLPDHGLSHLGEVSFVFQNFLGWSQSEVDEQQKKLLARIDQEMKWKSSLD